MQRNIEKETMVESRFFRSLDKPTQNRLTLSAQSFRFEPQEFLLDSQSKWNTVFLLNSGSVRMYYLDRDGKEHNKAFFVDHAFFWPVTESLRNEPAGFFIESIESGSGWRWDFDVFKQTFANENDWMTFSHLWMENVLAEKFNREKDWLQLTAAQRYVKLITLRPELKRLPNMHLASYIGVTPESFSRLKKSISLTK
ncbi:Crp/Fnr family transcriptional regulator [Vibrio penaeicida]|uniref:Crp/Fnr family transcriptional regulator n=1 Tax=Vibrio penaeicida TaxID=104609 RepID=UPI0011AB8B4D|nr:Crp/Fnr family transcriptional regulator [Vibrio penaeicida]